jgi:hypothetical protein
MGMVLLSVLHSGLLTVIQGQDLCHRIRQVLRRRIIRRVRQGHLDNVDLQTVKPRAAGRVFDKSTTVRDEQAG